MTDEDIKLRFIPPPSVLDKEKKNLSKEQFDAAMEHQSMAIYRCKMGTGSNFQEGVRWAVRYLKQHPEMLDRL